VFCDHRASWSYTIGDQQGFAKLGTRSAACTEKWYNLLVDSLSYSFVFLPYYKAFDFLPYYKAFD